MISSGRMTRRTLLSVAPLPLLAAASEIQLIIIGDDIGAVHAIGEGTMLAYQKGIMRTANLIVPGPWLLEAAKQFEANPGLDVGIHLTLTSEWDTVKWRPLTAMPSLTDAHGFLPPRTRDVLAPGVKLSEVERELRAQIELAKRLIPRACSLSAHMGAATASPALRELTQRLAAEYKSPIQNELQSMHRIKTPYSGNSTAEEKVSAMVTMIEALGPGLHSMLDHPATDTPEMRRVSHAGNENVAEQRAGVLHAWTHPRVMEAVQKQNIKLTSIGASLA